MARIAQRGRAVSRRCFAADGTRMVMPAFGAFTGGLNIRDAAFADLFGALKFTAHMLGEGRLYAVRGQALPADRINPFANTTLAIQPVSSAISVVTKP